MAATPRAFANPLLKATAEPKLPNPANTAARIATPNAAPSWRNMLSVPDALPISPTATALMMAFCKGGRVIETPMPVMISGAINAE